MTRIQRGQAITFRLPSDTPEHIIKEMQKLKETERRNFSSKIAEFVLDGVSNNLSQARESVTIPLPKQLTKEQRNWLKHSHSEALLGSIVYQLLADPVRATSVLASLNSNSIDIDEALYLQEMSDEDSKDRINDEMDMDSLTEVESLDFEEDDLLHFDLDKARKEIASSTESSPKEQEEENADDLLGDFLAKMNK